MRATVKGSFTYPHGGTMLTLVKPGETVTLALPTRGLEVKIRGTGFMDFDIGRPTFRADLYILVDGVQADEVPVRTEVLTRP